ncbi:MAG: DNA polymerase III subunit alpha [Bacteroidota bacterium]
MRYAYYLNCHSYFSLRFGTLSVQELVDLAVEHQIEALALTDVHNMSACYEFVRACREAGIHPVVGMEFRQDDQLLYILLAKSLAGFAEINRWYTQHSLAKEDWPELPPQFQEVYAIYPWEKRKQLSLRKNELLGIRPQQINQLGLHWQGQTKRVVLLQPIVAKNKVGYNLHRLLRAIDHNVMLSKLPEKAVAGKESIFQTPQDLEWTCAAYLDVLTNTSKLLASCSFDVDFSLNRTRKTYTGDTDADRLLLKKLAIEGLNKRYAKPTKAIQARLKRELEIISELDFLAYFLITWDVIRYSQSRGFFHVGRGSGANSLVAYCLGITDVDPIELDLYFERFLNPERTSPPDFDIDFSWTDRDEVIEYMFRRYRDSHVSLLATYTTFQGRASIREMAKVFGLPKREIDLLVMNRDAPSQGLDSLSRQVLRYAKRLQGLPNHLSIHAGGVLISEDPIHHASPLDLPPKGFPITQFDMRIAEDINLHKFDILSQRGLAHIRECVDIIQRNYNQTIPIHEVEKFKRDPKVNARLAKGQTMGCFYIESPAMRTLLTKLRCKDYPTLVAASSVIRPGVARSGMMQAYIERHNGKLFSYPHPKLGELLEETYGIMVYQEDVIKVLHYFAGLSLAEADLVRRAMSGKAKGSQTFARVSKKYFDACREKGYPDDIVKELWRQIESFAGYSFSKAHSASFAVESYQSLYLKTYYPLAFIVAVINNFGGFYRTEIYIHEAKMEGATVHPPCVNHSEYMTRLIEEDIYLGFVHLKDLSKELGQTIAIEREKRGPFIDLADFARRLPSSKEQLTILIRIGAFDFTGKSKPSLLWELLLFQHGTSKQADILFLPPSVPKQLPDLESSYLTDAYDQMELLGFPLVSPFQLLQHDPPNLIKAVDFPEHVNRQVRVLGYLICIKQTTTIHKERMQFANFYDPDGTMFDVVRFPPAVKKYSLAGAGVYLIEGKVSKEFGTYSLDSHKVLKMPYQLDPRLGQEVNHWSPPEEKQ